MWPEIVLVVDNTLWGHTDIHFIYKFFLLWNISCFLNNIVASLNVFFFHQKYRFCEIVVYRMIQQNSVTTGCANCMTSSSDIETVSTSPNSRMCDSNGSCLIGDSSIELARLVSDAEWKLEMDVSSARIELRLLLVLELMLLLLVLIELWMPWRFRRCFVRSPGEKKNKI